MSETINGYEYITATGVIVPDVADVKAAVQSEWLAIWPSMPLDDSTPQGVMITAETLARSNVLKNNAAIGNQINPQLSGGIFLDAIAALTGLGRTQETFSRIPGATVAGVPETIIPQGSQASTPAGDLFETEEVVTIGAGGSATVDFLAVQPGPVPCGAGATLAIVTGVLGWETAAAVDAATLGTATQGDAAFKALRNVTLGIQGKSSNVAIQSAVNALPGVIGTQYRENIANTTQTINGISLVANSFWIVVDGGVQQQIANAILQAKGQGVNWNGGTVVSAVEPVSGQTYSVHYDVPVAAPIVIRVTCKQQNYIGNPGVDVVAAVLNYAANNVPNTEGFVVGNSVSPFEIAAAVAEQCAGLYIQKVEVSLASTISYGTVEIPLALNQKATVNSGSISVVVNS